MTIWRDLPGAATDRRSAGSVVTLGTFDGVHRGHQALLALAGDLDGPLVAVTFDPHPVEVLAPDQAPRRLTSVERRVELLGSAGADEVRALAFDREMAGWSPQEFVDRVLVDQLAATDVVIGANFTFGSKAAGTPEVLRELGETRGFTVHDVGLTGGDPPWSSTRVRQLVGQGLVADAAEVLGRPHAVEGVVVRGEQRGRELGYPTANVPVDDVYAVPPDGVYAGRVVRASGEPLPAAVSIGTNPTFGEHARRVESYVLDHTDLDLYGEAIGVELLERLRGMVAFDGVDALLAQMADDVTRTRASVASSRWA